MTPRKTTAIHPEPFTTSAGRLLCAAVVALVTACGGGGESTPTANVSQPVVTTPLPASPPPATAYSVVVKAVDTQGQPIAGVSVALVSARDLNARTGSDGTATFNFNASQSGESVLYANLTGYHTARRQFQLAGANSPNVQQLTLMRTDEAQLGLNGVTSVVSADASSVVVSVDISASDRSGNPIATLTAADFTVPAIDCFVGLDCILEPSGAPSSPGYWYPSRTTPVEATLSGTGSSAHYKVRYVLEAVPGMFTAGRTVVTYVDVRVGADTSLSIQVGVRL